MKPFFQVILPDVALLQALRRTLSKWLEESGVPDPPRTEIVFATHEAAANAIEHGNPEQPFEVRGDIVDRVLRVEISDTGRWRASRSDSDDRGRGLLLIKALAPEVEITTGRQGTTVHLVQQL